MTAAGLPLGARLGGGYELPGPVRDYLEGLGGIDAAVGHRAAAAYKELGETRAAIDVVMQAGDPAAAAASISDLSRALWAPFEFAELAGLVEALPADAIDAHPRVLLYLARAAGRADRFAHRYVALNRLEQLAAASADAVLRDEVNIEIAYDLLRLRRADEVPERIAGIDARLGSDQLHVRVQFLEVRGQHACRTDDYAEGERLLEEAKRLATQLGDRERGRNHRLSAGHRGLLLRGSHRRRARRWPRRVSLCIRLHSRGCGRVNLVADFATDLGYYEEAEAALREQAQLARRFRSERWTAYVPWGHARIASQQGDTERTVRAIKDVLDHHSSDQWFDTFEGTFFYCDAADMLDRVGETAWARTCLAAAFEKYDGHPAPMIDAIIEARSGDPKLAEVKFAALDDIRDSREQWRLELFRALAAFRRGDADAGTLAAAAFERAAADGLDDSTDDPRARRQRATRGAGRGRRVVAGPRAARRRPAVDGGLARPVRSAPGRDERDVGTGQTDAGRQTAGRVRWPPHHRRSHRGAVARARPRGRTPWHSQPLEPPEADRARPGSPRRQ